MIVLDTTGVSNICLVFYCTERIVVILNAALRGLNRIIMGDKKH